MSGSNKIPAGHLAPPSSGLAAALAKNWGPLFTNRLFRALWLANLASDFGYWMNSVGASWTMTELSISPLLNTCIQASTASALVARAWDPLFAPGLVVRSRPSSRAFKRHKGS